MYKKKPTYYQKSKAAKEIEQTYNNYSPSPISLSDSLGTYKGRERGRKEKYIRDYKYTGYGDRYEGRPYNYDSEIRSMYDRLYINDSEMYDMRNDIHGYTTQESQGQLHNRGTKPYVLTETAYSDESDSEWWDRHRRRGNSVSDSLEYTSEYSYKDRKPRQIYPDRNLYKKNYNVFVTQQPPGHKAFTYKKYYKPMKQTSYTTLSETETATDEEISYTLMREQMKQPKQQVYVTQIEHDQAKVFGQKVTRDSQERELSVTEYGRNIPIIMLKDKKQNFATNKNQHEVVYMPCVVLDKNIKLTKSKIGLPEPLIEQTRETKNKPLETNVQIYAATETDIGNIFKQEENNPANEDKRPLVVQDKINTVDLGKSKSINIIKTTSSITREKSTTSEDSLSQLYYPVQKSYINVAPSKLKPRKKVDKKRSSGTSHSIIGVPKPGSIRGSGFYSKIQKKDLSDKRERRRKLLKQKEKNKFPEKILAVVDPISYEKEIQQHEEAKMTTALSINGYNQQVEKDKEQMVHNITQQKASEVKLPATISFPQLHKKSLISHKNNRSVDKEGISRSIGNDKKVISVDENGIRKSMKSTHMGIKGRSIDEKIVRGESKTVLNIKMKPSDERRSLKYGQKSMSYDRSKISHEKEVTGEEKKVFAKENSKEKDLENIYGRYESYKSEQGEGTHKLAPKSIQRTESRVMPLQRSFTQKIFRRKKKDPVSKCVESKDILNQIESRTNVLSNNIAESYEQRKIQPVLSHALIEKHHERVLKQNNMTESYEQRTIKPVLSHALIEKHQERVLKQNNIAESYEQRTIKPVLSYVLDEQRQDRIVKKKHPSKTRSLTKTITKEFIHEVNGVLKSEMTHQLNVWRYNIGPLIVLAFKKAEYFLGLSLHDTLLEAVHTFSGHDLT